MKTLQSFILFFFPIFMYSQNVYIPDSNFKNYLVTNTDVNTNGDSEIQMSEASSFTGSLSFQFWQVDNLIGIEAFTNLTFLDCGDNNLTNIDLSQNIALEQLYCYDNQLVNLDLSANVNLVALDCRDNSLTTLDLSNNSNLYYLQCPFNNLTSLNVSNTAIQTLRCYSNALTNLDISNTESTLKTLLVYNNNLIDLDLSNYFALEIFECQNSSTLTNVNIANSNNMNITTFRSTNTPNLECIEVDDEIYSTSNWTNVDPSTSFSEDCSSLSVSEYEGLIINFYPNPVTNYLHLETFEALEEYSIISLKGEVIKNGALIKRSNILDVSNLSQSIYIIQLKTISGKSFSTRFVKK